MSRNEHVSSFESPLILIRREVMTNQNENISLQGPLLTEGTSEKMERAALKSHAAEHNNFSWKVQTWHPSHLFPLHASPRSVLLTYTHSLADKCTQSMFRSGKKILHHHHHYHPSSFRADNQNKKYIYNIQSLKIAFRILINFSPYPVSQ